MRHNLVVTAVLASALPGCFDAHGIVAGADAGPPRGDAGPVITTCDDARIAPDGAACDFDEVCEGFVTDCGPPSRTQCVDGRIRHLRPICTRAPVTNCDEYLAWSFPGDFCLPESFTGCTLDAPGCCARTIACVANAIVDTTACGDCDPDPDVCEGYAPPPPELPTCTSDDDCDGGIPCAPPGTPAGCGACLPPDRACEADADCGAGNVCIEIENECTCAGPISFCQAACNGGDVPCPEGTRCADDGRCVALACASGEWECGPNQVCGEGGAIDAHGCGRVACERSADCACGACIDGLCHDGPGTCRPPVP